MGLIYLSNFVSIELHVLPPPANEAQFEVGAQILPPPETAQGTDRNKNMPIFYLSIIYFIKDQGKQKNNPECVNYEFLTGKKYNFRKF